jgi:AraC family transcriptional regulator, transcriptional activator of pobA
MPLIHKFKFGERFVGDNFLKFISMGEYNRVYKPKVEIPHTHNYFLLMLFTKGTGKHYVDFKEYPIKKNALYLIAPGQIHHLKRSKGTDGFDVIFEEHFYCSGIARNEVILPPPFFRNSLVSPYIQLDEEQAKFVASIFSRIKNEFENNVAGKWEVIRSLLNVVISRCEILSSRVGVNDSTKYKRAFKLLNEFTVLVEKYFAKEKQISFYADKLSITTNHLIETVREVTGDTPVDMIRSRALLEAKRKLLENKLSVKEVSHLLGYENTSYFSKVFKEDTGFTPAEFRIRALEQ